MAPYPKMTPRKMWSFSFPKAAAVLSWSSGDRFRSFFRRIPLSRRRNDSADSRLFDSGTEDHLCSGTHRHLRQLRSRSDDDRQPAHPDPHAGSDARHLDTSGLPRLSFPSRFPRLASDYRIFHFRCDLSGTRPVHDTDDTLRHRSRSVSLHLSGIQ